MVKKGFYLSIAVLIALAIGAIAGARASSVLAESGIPQERPTRTPIIRPTRPSGGTSTATATVVQSPTPTPTDEPGPTATAQPTATVPVPSPTPGGSPEYDYYRTGNPQDVDTPTGGGLVLQGGGTDVDEAFQWLIDRSGGGDFVVIRASGADGYNGYVYSLGAVDSVETLVIKSRSAAEDPFVLGIIQNAEALFIAGGDQWNYVDYWKGTLLEDAIHALRDQNVPIGGTSAGLAILGEYLFSAENGTVYSNEALGDPYNMYMTLEQDFLTLPHLSRVITDSHFKQRNRMGRLVGFLARILQDGWSTEAKGIGVNEQTALLVDTDGSATVVGTGAVFFLHTPGAPEVCQPRTPLTFLDVGVYRIYAGGTFNLPAWTGSGGTLYEVSANNSSITSTLPRGLY